jgi:hypothetical protein
MKTALSPLPACLTAQQLSQADELALLQLHQQAEAEHNDAFDYLIQAEVARRIRFDLIGSVAVYNAFMPAYQQYA